MNNENYIKQLEEQNSQLQEQLAVVERENYVNDKILRPGWGPCYYPPQGLEDDPKIMSEFRNDFFVLATVSKCDKEKFWYTDFRFFNVPCDRGKYISFDDAKKYVEDTYNKMINDLRNDYVRANT